MIDREALILRRASLDEIACGCSVDHPDFDTVLRNQINSAFSNPKPVTTR